MKQQNLASGQRKIEVRALRHHADQSFDGNLFLPDIVLTNPCLTAGRLHARGQNSYRRRLSCTVGAEQAEYFSDRNVQGQSIQRDDLGMLLRLLAAARRRRAKPASSGKRRRGSVDLA